MTAPPQLDPFIIYTVKLAMDFKSVEPTTPIPTRSSRPFEKEDIAINQEQDEEKKKYQDNFTNPMFPDTMARIMTIKSYQLKSGEKIPKLRRDNILSLLYHADEQWSNSSIDLTKLIKSNGQDEKKIQYAVEHVHHQQRIYLDTLHLLHKSVFPNETHRRYNEPIWFAAQVLYSQCQIRHLECFTDIILPLATKVHESIEQIRLVTRRLLQKQQTLKQHYLQQQQQQESIFTSFISNFITSSNTGYNSNDKGFYNSDEHKIFLRKLEPHLVALSYHWAEFEKTLYECYVHTVFGKYHTNAIMEEQQKSTSLCQEILQQQQQLPSELFHDHFTQLLPIILERAINLQIIDIQSIQSLDPIAFVAVPRLAILAGVTWLAHLTGWRNKKSIYSNNLPIWIKSHVETLSRITLALDQLEIQLLKNQSEDAHHSFVQRYQKLEQALVSGRSMDEEIFDSDNDICQQLEKEIFIDICMVADSVLSSNRAKAFTVVLCHLFRHFGLQYDIEFEESEDAVPLDQTILDLAI